MPRKANVLIKYTSANTSKTKTSSKSSKNTDNASNEIEYTIKSSDTLWSIAKQYLGEGIKYTEIYKQNKDIIEKVAKQHNLANSDNGHWIFPGTKIKITSGTTQEVHTANKSNKSVSENISAKVTAFTYTDVANGKSDSISINILDIDKEWLGDGMPVKGSSVEATIKTSEWEYGSEAFNCGTFELDDISFSGRPLECQLSAVSAPTNDDFKTKTRTVTWQSTTLKDIAQKIADRANVKLYYSGDSIKITEREQNKKTDSAFLKELCDMYDFFF